MWAREITKNMNNKNLVIITWISASWKTTVQQELEWRGWLKPINFTTREPRSDRELDEYVFLSREQFFKKLKNDDFLETTSYNWNNYWISKHIFKDDDSQEDMCVVLDPIWRATVLEKVVRWELECNLTTVYLDCSKDLQRKRLEERWDSVLEIRNRTKDSEWFHSIPWDLILISDFTVEEIADKIEEKNERIS